MNSIFNNQLDAECIDENEINPAYEDVLEYSQNLANVYVQERQMLEDGLTALHLMTLASARLQCVLAYCHAQISGLFTEREIHSLLDCNQERLFMPGRFSSIASDFCNHHGVELEDYASSGLQEIIGKLRALDSMQCLALGDALEQTWHRGMKNGLTPKEFLETLDIELR